MKRNKILLLVNNKELVDILKTESEITFLFPLSGFSVGFENYFSINDIKVSHAYLFINRLLDHEGIKKFEELLLNIPSNIKGIVSDDIGVLQLLLKHKSNLTKILFLNHLNSNYESINAWLDYADSVIPSTDITIHELDEILLKAKKPLTLYAFGHINIMYSRRTLITNYNKHFKSKIKSQATLEEIQTHKSFKIIENEYGTVIYTSNPYSGLELTNKEPALFYLINTVFLSNEEVLKILKSNSTMKEIYPYTYLSQEETIYKIKEENHG